VLTRTPLFTFGPFTEREDAQQFADRKGGIVLEWDEPHPIVDGCLPAFGAVLFNNDWNDPYVIGPFYDTDAATK
jgi:hypothetical protein